MNGAGDDRGRAMTDTEPSGRSGGPAENVEPNTDCNFCLELIQPDESVRCFPCCPRIAQHTECLGPWLDAHNTCIVCKKRVPDVLRQENKGE